MTNNKLQQHYSFKLTKGSLFIVSCFLLALCTNKQEQPKVTEAKQAPRPQYLFYPKANVYYDTVGKNYFFVAAEGNTWQSVKQLPEAMQNLMDKNVLIEVPSTPVWRDNERHKIIYAALLYAAPEDTQATKPVVITKPQSLPPKVEEKKDRKGIKSFFDKIFKRNKKEKTPE